MGLAEAEGLCGSLRGISALTGLALTIEIDDWSRYTGSSIGADVGLVPCEYPGGAIPPACRDRWVSGAGGACGLDAIPLRSEYGNTHATCSDPVHHSI